jgi:hypothetical protein
MSDRALGLSALLSALTLADCVLKPSWVAVVELRTLVVEAEFVSGNGLGDIGTAVNARPVIMESLHGWQARRKILSGFGRR